MRCCWHAIAARTNVDARCVCCLFDRRAESALVTVETTSLREQTDTALPGTGDISVMESAPLTRSGVRIRLRSKANQRGIHVEHGRHANHTRGVLFPTYFSNRH